MRLAKLALIAALGLGSTGCIKSMLLKGQIKSTRQASSAVDTLHDYEVARAAAYAGLAQFEGMHKLAPTNVDALFMLTKGWTGATFAFTEDEWEVAEDLKQREVAEYHRLRAIAGYERAIAYGIEMFAAMGKDGWADARKSPQAMTKWLKDSFDDKDDAAPLFWVGYAWLGKTNVNKEDPDTVADLWVAIAILERSVALDRTYNFASGLTALAAYHARTPMAELDEAKALFDEAMAQTGNRSLIQKVNYATRYLCAKSDKAGYMKALQEVLDAGDVLPEARLTNAIGKRRARRYLGKARLDDARENCAFPD
ncbi:MAG: hypothetical protein IT374_08600 [Polyangiaceae bacterium]|nr:hypothetical protein [Polyangiaceae bacterium]